MRVFIDTNVLVAVKDVNDSTHKRAQNIFLQEIVGKKYKAVISTQVLSEALTVLSQKISKQAAFDLINELKGYEIVYINSTIVSSATKIFEQVRSKNISFADCTTIVICQSKKYKIDALFSFDKHFENQGIQLLHKII